MRQSETAKYFEGIEKFHRIDRNNWNDKTFARFSSKFWQKFLRKKKKIIIIIAWWWVETFTIQNFENFAHLWSDIFARLKRVTFKLGKFTYCKAFVWLLSLDFLWLLLIERKKITRGCIIDNWNFSKASESILFRFLFISRSWPPSEWPPLWYKTNGSNCRRRRSHSTFMALASGDSCEGSKQRAIVLQVWWDSGNASVCCNSGALCFPDSLSRIIWNKARWGWYKLSCQSVKFRSN